MTKREQAKLEKLLPNWSSVRVKSCADGSMQVIPRWRGIKPYTRADGGGPGLFTRLDAANRLRSFLNAALKGARK